MFFTMKDKQMKKNWIVLLSCLAMLFSGCSDSGTSGANNTSAENKESAGSAKKETAHSEEAWNEKAQVYIRYNNSINSFLTSRAAKNTYEKAKKGDFKSLATNTHQFDDEDVKDLKEALALSGKMPEVDATVNKLIEVIEKYVPNWNNLLEYNKAKRYEDDNGAKGKEMLPMYIEGMEALRAAISAFSEQVSVIAKQSHEKALAKYKAEGKLLEMHTLEALGAAEGIIETFSESDDFKDQSKIDAANALLADMEKNLEGMKTEHAKRKENNSDRKNLPLIDRYDSVHSNLSDMAGAYREARKNPNRFNDAISKFNNAISEYNRMQR